jgi:hypothetical protein
LVEVEGVIGGVVFGDLNLDRKLPLDLYKVDDIDVVISNELGAADTDKDLLLFVLFIVYTVKKRKRKRKGKKKKKRRGAKSITGNTKELY